MPTPVDPARCFSMLLRHFVVVAALAFSASLPSLLAQTILFSDTFNRANQADLDAVTNGMSGFLLTNGTLTASNIWIEPVDVAHRPNRCHQKG